MSLFGGKDNVSSKRVNLKIVSDWLELPLLFWQLKYTKRKSMNQNSCSFVIKWNLVFRFITYIGIEHIWQWSKYCVCTKWRIQEFHPTLKLRIPLWGIHGNRGNLILQQLKKI